MTGGNAVKNIIVHSMVQPPVVFFQRSARGSRKPKTRSLKIKNKITNASRTTIPMTVKTRWRRVISPHTVVMRLLSFSTLLMRLSRQALERFCGTNGEVLPVEADLRGGCQGLSRAARGDCSSASGSVICFDVIFQVCSVTPQDRRSRTVRSLRR